MARFEKDKTDIRVFSHKRADKMEPIEKDSIFQSASLSKALFASLVSLLARDKYLDLDRPLTDYCSQEEFGQKVSPFLKKYYPELYRYLKKDDISAADLLSHQSGLLEIDELYCVQKFTRENLLGSFHYSGVGYLVLQAMIENIYQPDLESIAKKYLLLPFGMIHFGFVWNRRFATKITTRMILTAKFFRGQNFLNRSFHRNF